MYSSIIKYDKQKRPISMSLPDVGLEYLYIYSNKGRTVILESKKQKSNYKTIIHQKLIGSEYKDCTVLQEGDVYDIEIEYDDFGNEKNLKRTNKQKDTKYSKRTFIDKNGIPLIWAEVYNGITSIGFKVDLEKILLEK